MYNLPFELKSRIILYREKDFKIKKKFPKYSVNELFNIGIINLNKPKKYYCSEIDNKLTNLLEVPRIGHAGTLDPMVDGVLPIMLMKTTKISDILSKAGKVYDCEMHVHEDIEKKKIIEVLKLFEGKIKQFPPKRSAVKRQWRTREVYGIKLLKIKKRDVFFIVWCEAGTYIRTLCVDIGEKLGVGAHMIALKRIQVASLKIKDSIEFDKLIFEYKKYLSTKDESSLNKLIIPKEKALNHLPKIWVDKDIKTHLKNGSPVFAPGILAVESEIEKGEFVAVFSENNDLWVIGKADMTSKEMIKKKKGLAIKTSMVLI